MAASAAKDWTGQRLRHWTAPPYLTAKAALAGSAALAAPDSASLSLGIDRKAQRDRNILVLPGPQWYPLPDVGCHRYLLCCCCRCHGHVGFVCFCDCIAAGVAMPNFASSAEASVTLPRAKASAKRSLRTAEAVRHAGDLIACTAIAESVAPAPASRPAAVPKCNPVTAPALPAASGASVFRSPPACPVCRNAESPTTSWTLNQKVISLFNAAMLGDACDIIPRIELAAAFWAFKE